MKITKQGLGYILLLYPLSGILILLTFTRLSEFYDIVIHYNFSYVAHSLQLAFLSSFPFVFAGFIGAYFLYTGGGPRVQKFSLSVAAALFFVHPVILLSLIKAYHALESLHPLAISSMIYGLHSWSLSMLIGFAVARKMSQYAFYSALQTASPANAIFVIVLPQLLRYVFLLGATFFIFYFFAQDVPSILGYRTFGEVIFSYIIVGDNTAQILSAVLLIVVPFAVLIYYFAGTLKRLLESITVSNIYTSLQSCAFKPLAAMMAVLCLALISWIGYGFLRLLPYADVSITQILRENVHILLISGVIAIVASLLGMIVSRMLYYFTPKSRLIVFVLLFYFLIPRSVLALIVQAPFEIVDIPFVRNQWLLFFAGYVYGMLPISYFLFWLQRRFIQDRFFCYVEIPIWRRVIFVELPMQKMFIFAEFLILTVVALYELDIPLLLAPVGVETVIVKIYNLLHYGDMTTISFLSLCIILTVSSIAYVVTLGNKRETFDSRR